MPKQNRQFWHAVDVVKRALAEFEKIRRRPIWLSIHCSRAADWLTYHDVKTWDVNEHLVLTYLTMGPAPIESPGSRWRRITDMALNHFQIENRQRPRA